MCFDDILIEGGMDTCVGGTLLHLISYSCRLNSRGLKSFHKKMFVTAVSQQRNVQLFTYSGGSTRWLIMSSQNYF